MPPRLANTTSRSHYASFSPFRRRNARDTWRRISMLLTLLARLALLIVVGILLLYRLRSGVAVVVVPIVFALVALGLLLADCWSLALIGDATGMRRSCGITVVSGARIAGRQGRRWWWMTLLM